MENCEERMTTLSISSSWSSTPSVVERQVDDDPSGVNAVLVEYFRPLYVEYLGKCGWMDNYVPEDFKVDRTLMRSVFEFTWGPDVFKTSRPVLKRLHKELSLKLNEGPSEESHYLQYFHVDVISARLNLLVLSIALVDVSLVTKQVAALEWMIEDDQRIVKYAVATDACKFLFSTLKRLYAVLSNVHTPYGDGTNYPDFHKLSKKTQNYVKGLSVLFIKMFRVKHIERCDLMRQVHKNDSACLEWVIYLSEFLRLRRRDAPPGKQKFATMEELDLVNLSLQMEPTNPFVRLNLFDTVVDAIRESNGRFSIEHLKLQDLDEAIQWLKDECEKLVQEFRWNVRILSTVSDIFLRLVPVRYVDKEFSSLLLQSAYNLNPKNPKTNHRYGIYYRMTERNMDKSLEFLEKAVTLDIALFNANLDYFKSLLSKRDKYLEIRCRMKRRLESEEVLGWRPTEYNDFRFLLGIACFAAGEKEETLHQWQEVLKFTEIPFSLADADQDCSYFEWDENVIGAEKLRHWVFTEHEIMMGELEKAGGESTFDPERKKTVDKLFHLAMGCTPKRPICIGAPYTAEFEHRIDQRVFNEIMMTT